MRFLTEWECHKFAGELISEAALLLEPLPSDQIAPLDDWHTWGTFYAGAVRAVEGLETYLRTNIATEALEAFSELANAMDRALGDTPDWAQLHAHMVNRLSDALHVSEAR